MSSEALSTVTGHWQAIFVTVAVHFLVLFSCVKVSCFPKVLIFLNLRKYSTKDTASPVSSVALAEYQLESLNSALPQKYDVAQGRKCEPAESGSLFNLIRLT